MKGQKGKMKGRKKKGEGRRTNENDHRRDRRDIDKRSDEIEYLREYKKHRKDRMKKGMKVEEEKE